MLTQFYVAIYGFTRLQWVNSLAPGRFLWNFRWVIFMLISVIDDWFFSCEIAIRFMYLDLTDDKSTLVQVMAWCHQATSHYLSQCWPRFMVPYGVIRPQWVKMKTVACWDFFLKNGHYIYKKNFKLHSLATLSYIIAWVYFVGDIDESVQDCSNSIANALELLQSCTKPSIS